MDAQKDTLICRLCGINLVEGKYKSIFEGSTDLMHKIKETLPISISIDDNGSKYVCLPCYDKTTLYYKFIQEVVEYSKGLENVPQLKSFFDLTKEVTEFSQIHSDAVYTCPNCNVDLMILLVSNPQGCDYTFQISLAMVNHSDKKHSLVKEKSIHLRENLTHLNNSKSSEQSKNANKIAPIEDIENISNKDIENISNKDIETISIKGIENISNPMKLSENASLIVEKVDVEKKLKRRLEESDSHDPFIRSSKILKLDEISNENLPSCDYDSRLLLAKNESKNSLLAKTDLESDNMYWLDSEMDCKSEKEAYAIESQKEDDLYKSYMKYVCKLCGARYHSHLKYEFHMERHKAGKMDKYECTMCEKETSKENLLWDHYYHTHKSLQRFICMECGKIFAKRSRLNGHQKTNKHSGVKQIQVAENDDAINEEVVEKVTITQQEKITVNCNLCGKLISDLDPDAINDLVTCADCEDSTLSLMVDGNETKVISPRQYHCSMCPKHFVRKERLEFHEMRHNENMNEFICSTCGKDFRAENSLYEHYLFVHKGARPHICELCGKSFQLKARLKEHHRIHTGERPFQCDICGQRCRTTNALKLHRKIHFSHNRYACNVCSKSFSKKQNMNEHLEKHWKNDKNVSLPQLFTCPICVEDFPTYRMLKYHMIEVHEVSNQDPILTKQKPWYECAECHEKFKHQMSLKAHKERVHEGRVDPNYQCDLCNATYRVKQLLVNHIKSKHNGERRYKCAQCEKGFNDTKSLYNHVLLHTGKKPFVCEYCNMSFRRKDSRDHHRRKHTGEQPYQCPDCGESFSTYNNRSKHRKREHGERDPECPECGEKCSNQQEIRIHLNKHLGEKLKRLQNIKSDEA